MRTVNIFVLSFCFTFPDSSCSAKPSVHSALSSVIENFFESRSEFFEFIIYGLDSEINDVLNRMNRETRKRGFVCKVRRVLNGSDEINIKNSALMVFDNMNDYRSFHRRALKSRCAKTLHFLVYIRSFDKNKLFFVKDTSFLAETFLVEHDDESLKLITFAQFQQPNCRAWREIEVNRYSLRTRQWRTNQYFVEKFNDFNGCELISCAYQMGVSEDIRLDGSQKIEKLYGRGVDLNDIIGGSLNYSIFYNQHLHDNRLKMRMQNESIENDYPLMAYSTRMILGILSEGGVVTQPFTMSKELIVIPPDELYSQFEKLFLPFDEEVWFWLFVTMSIAVITIVVIGFAPEKVRKFVFGTSVETPMLNLL